MTKKEIKKAKTNKIIVDLVETYSVLTYNINCGGGTKQYSNHCDDLMNELISRGILEQSDMDWLNK